MTHTSFSSARKISSILKIAFAIAAIAFALSAAATAQTISEIAWISDTYSGLAFDSAGNLYGVTAGGAGGGGTCNGGCGQVFELSPDSGGWTQTVLYNFVGGDDGSYPGGLVVDAAGNLYGTTSYGGSSGCGSIGCGTVFKLSRSGGDWKETLIHVFTDTEPQDGLYAGFPLVFDAEGNLYGTTGGGGVGTFCNGGGCGVAFRLSPASGGQWKENVLYSFPGGAAGFNALGPLTFDAKGNLYGVMQAGGDFSTACGSGGCGLIFELVNTAHGWKQGILHTFHDADGHQPNAGLIFDAAGNLYGTTFSGGRFTDGLAFKLSPVSGGWKETSLYNFTGGNDGSSPTAGLAFDKLGNLYGTTANGTLIECDNDICGQAFELSPVAGGWKLSAQFATPQDYYPLGGLVLGRDGNLYGTAYDNHYLTGGVAFEITP